MSRFLNVSRLKENEIEYLLFFFVTVEVSPLIEIGVKSVSIGAPSSPCKKKLNTLSILVSAPL